MADTEVSKVGKRGAVILPARLRKRFGIQDGSYVVAEEREEGILIRPAAVVPYERYTPERVAEFLLGSAVDGQSYKEAVAEVRRMGLDPEKIEHFKPPRK
jgi:AbrB family looped-hinge helix DNA binding protein